MPFYNILFLNIHRQYSYSQIAGLLNSTEKKNDVLFTIKDTKHPFGTTKGHNEVLSYSKSCLHFPYLNL